MTFSLEFCDLNIRIIIKNIFLIWKDIVRICLLSLSSSWFWEPLAIKTKQKSHLSWVQWCISPQRPTGWKWMTFSRHCWLDVGQACQTHGPTAACLIYLAHVSIRVWHAWCRCLSSTCTILPGYWRHLFNIAAASKRGGFCLQHHLCHLNFLLLLNVSFVPHITAYVDRDFGCSLRDPRVQILNVP